MKKVNCIICHQDSTRLYEKKDGYTLVQCLNDDLIYVNPQPEERDLKAFYDSGQYFLQNNSTLGYGNYLSNRPANLKNDGKIIQRIKKIVRNGRLLDVACAYGFALTVARDEGFEVYGNDLNSTAVKYAENKLNLSNVQLGTLESLNLDNNFFDVVTMIGSIEHFDNPARELQESHRILKSGGIMAILTVNLDTLIGRRSIKPPEHLYYFTDKTLRNLLENNGFEIIKKYPRFMPNLFYFTSNELIVAMFNYISNLTTNDAVKKILLKTKNLLLSLAKKMRLNQLVLPAVDGQFLIIAKRKKWPVWGKSVVN